MSLASDRFSKCLAAVALAGGALRAFYIFVLTPNQLGAGDWGWYSSVANQIATGQWFDDPYAAAAGQHLESASHPPLYPVVLSPISLLGGTSYQSHRAAGILLGAAGIVLMGLLARRIAGARAGIAAAVLTALYPVFIAADGALLSETLYTPVLAGTLLCAYRVRDDPSVWSAVALGALIGLCALTRSEALAFIAILAVPVAWGAREGRWLRLGGAGLAFVVVLTPWTIRNFNAFDRLVPVSTQSGALVAGANCRDSYYGPDTGGWVFSCLSKRTAGDEAAQGSIWQREGVDYARAHMQRLPVVLGARMLKLMDFYQPRRQLMFAEGRNHKVEGVGIGVYYLLLPLAIFGVVLLRRRGAPLYILATPVATVAVAALLGYGVTRLRHAADMVIVICAAVALVRFEELARARLRGRPEARPAAAR